MSCVLPVCLVVLSLFLCCSCVLRLCIVFLYLCLSVFLSVFSFCLYFFLDVLFLLTAVLVAQLDFCSSAGFLFFRDAAGAARLIWGGGRGMRGGRWGGGCFRDAAGFSRLVGGC